MAVPQYPVKPGENVAELTRRIRRLETIARTGRGGLPGSVVGGITHYTANHVAALADIGRLAQMDSAASITFTLPSNATVPIPIGQGGRVVQWGTGLLTVVWPGTVTVRAAGGMHIARARYSTAWWTKTGTNEFLLYGDLTP